VLLYILKRILASVPLLIGITFISFFIMQMAPGEPMSQQMMLNPEATPQALERFREIYGLNDPIYVQYYNWLKRIVMLDFGRSFSPDRRPVFDKVTERMPITILISALSMLLIFSIAIPIGVVSAVKQYSLFDNLTTLFVFIGFAVPTFWLAILLMLLFGVRLEWLPVSGFRSLNFDEMSAFGQFIDVARHLILPVFVSAFGGIAGISRYTRSNMLEVIRQDYITTARSKGLSEKIVVYKHALRNALLPVITILGLSVPGLIGGSVIFESIFAIPGMGKLMYDAVMSRDYTVIMGTLFISSVLTLLGNLLADVGYAVSDPRIRMSS